MMEQFAIDRRSGSGGLDTSRLTAGVSHRFRQGGQDTTDVAGALYRAPVPQLRVGTLFSSSLRNRSGLIGADLGTSTRQVTTC